MYNSSVIHYCTPLVQPCYSLRRGKKQRNRSHWFFVRIKDFNNKWRETRKESKAKRMEVGSPGLCHSSSRTPSINTGVYRLKSVSLNIFFIIILPSEPFYNFSLKVPLWNFKIPDILYIYCICICALCIQRISFSTS